MNTPVIAVGLLGAAALGGATLATIHLRHDRDLGVAPAPAGLAYGHGAIAAGGLGTLISAVADDSLTGPLARWALALLSVAALGGLGFLFGFRLRDRPIPRRFILGHGLLAATGFVLLCVAVFGRTDRAGSIGAAPAAPAEQVVVRDR